MLDSFVPTCSDIILDPALLRQIAGFVFDYIFNGKPRGLGSVNNVKLVEYGFARFGTSENVLADEPLPLLAATHHFTVRTPWNLDYFLLEGVSTSNDSARGTAVEQLGAYILALAFRSPRRLSDVFQFIGVNDLGKEAATLVALHKVNGGPVCTPIDISSNQRGAYILGHSTRTEMESLSWVRDPKRTAFCFPVHTLGPDLILFLQLSDLSILRVLVQFKHINTKTMGPQDTADAYRTTDPSQFFSQSKPIHKAASPQLRPYVPLLVSMTSSHSLHIAHNHGKPISKTLSLLRIF